MSGCSLACLLRRWSYPDVSSCAHFSISVAILAQAILAQGTADISYVAFLLITRDAAQLITQLDFTVQKRRPPSGVQVLSPLDRYGSGRPGQDRSAVAVAGEGLPSLDFGRALAPPFASTAHSDFPRVWIRCHAER